MKNQDIEAKLAAAREENEQLRNQIHNLKRRVKRMEERNAAENADRKHRTDEVTRDSMDDIKKKLMAAGLNDRTSEVMAWVMLGDTGTKKK